MEQLRFDSRVLHPEVQSVTRDSVLETQTSDRITRPYFTKYEFTRLMGTRAQQIAEGAKPLVSIDGMLTLLVPLVIVVGVPVTIPDS